MHLNSVGPSPPPLGITHLKQAMSIMIETLGPPSWLLYAENVQAPLCRKPTGSWRKMTEGGCWPSQCLIPRSPKVVPPRPGKRRNSVAGGSRRQVGGDHAGHRRHRMGRNALDLGEQPGWQRVTLVPWPSHTHRVRCVTVPGNPPWHAARFEREVVTSGTVECARSGDGIGVKNSQ